MANLERLLRPRSIAVLGGRWAENVLVQLERIGFTGAIHPVHPTRERLAGRRCLPALDALPAPPDATFLGVNRHATVDCVRTLAGMGAGGAVCFASGWAERGGHDLQDALVAAAGDMPVLGPNCYGFVNYLDGCLLWPDQHGGRAVARGVALVSQSSNVAINLSMQARGLPLAFIVCLGNAARVTLADLAATLLGDERITALGLYVEGIDDAAALAAVAEAARARGKGIVALRGGRTAAGAAAAATHTAALSGEDAASRAYLAQAGIADVATLDTLIETLKVLHVHGPLGARRFCAVTCSGGEAGLIADLADGVLELPDPSPDQRARLSAELGPDVALANPLDYQTFLWGEEAATARVFSAMLEGYDAGLFVIDPPRGDRCDPASFEPALAAVETAARRVGRPAFPVASLPENFGEARAATTLARGTVPLLGLECAVRALAAAATPPGLSGWRPLAAPPSPVEGTSCVDDEAVAKALLATAGVDVPRFVVAPTPAALVAAARASSPSLAPPFAMKGLGFLHKSEANAVRLYLDALDAQAPMDGASGYLAEEMVTGGVAELIVGLRRAPPYGLSLTLGSGGTAAELLGDVVTLIAPVTTAEIGAALRRLRLWPLLDGYRGRARADVAAAVETVSRLQALALAREDIVEIEINPLILRTRGAVAVDAIIRRRLP